MSHSPRVLFPAGFDNQSASEMIDRGYISVYVEIESGEYYSIWFFHPIRAQQELDHAVEAGRNFFTEEGALVLVPEVTVAAVVKAVKYLLKRSYFAY